MAALGLLLLDQFYWFGVNLSKWGWWYISGWITFFVTFKAALTLPGKLHAALSRLTVSQVIHDPENQLEEFQRGLDKSGRHAARLGGLITTATLALGWVTARTTALPSYALTALPTLVGGFLTGSFIGRAVSYSRLGDRLQRQGFTFNINPEHLDGVAGFRPIGRLYFFQSALVAVPGAFAAIWWFLIPLYGDLYNPWRKVYVGFLIFVISCEFLAFIRPMWSFHRIMKKGKDLLLIEADEISAQTVEIQKRLRGGRARQNTALENGLARLEKRYDAIVEMPTWPVDAAIRRRFALNNILLFIPVVAQLLDIPNLWKDVADALQKVVSGHG